MAATEYHKNIFLMKQHQFLMKHKNMIYERIDEATSINDIIPMLQIIQTIIPMLPIIKNIIKSKIETIAVDDISNISHSSLSIETILTTDLIQHIASFNNVSNIKSVSKEFNKCFKNNQMIQSKEYISPKHGNKNKNNETWVVDAKRRKLKDKEIELNYKGPVNDLQNAINAAKSGDKILIYEGKYSMKDVNINKALQIIGCGNVLIEYDGVTIANDIYFKNIKIKTCLWKNIKITEKCRLFMENCDMSLVDDGIQVNEDSVLSVVNCNFYAGLLPGFESNMAIGIHVHAKEVNVISCMFIGFGDECIWLDRRDLKAKAKVKLKCVDNLFKNGRIPISGAYLSDAVFRDNKEKNRDETVDVLAWYSL